MRERQVAPSSCLWPDLPYEIHWQRGKKWESQPAVGRKFCSCCGRWRHLHDFDSHARTVRGTMIRLQARCRTCTRVNKRIAGGFKQRRVGRGSPEELRAKKRAEYWRRRTDPEKVAEQREYQRIYKEAQRRKAGIKPRNFKKLREAGSSTERIPNEPLRVRFIELQAKEGLTPGDVARRLDWWVRGRPDEARVARMLGLRDSHTHGRVIRSTTITYPNAVHLAEALGMEPYEAGV